MAMISYAFHVINQRDHAESYNKALGTLILHSTKKPVGLTTMLTYPWKCTVLHCNHLGNTWKPLVLMTRHFDYCPSASEGDNQSVRSSAPVVSRCFPGGYNVKLYISRGRLAWWLPAFLHSAGIRLCSLYEKMGPGGGVDRVLDSRSKCLGFDSHYLSCVEMSGKLLIPYCLCIPSNEWVPGGREMGLSGSSYVHSLQRVGCIPPGYMYPTPGKVMVR